MTIGKRISELRRNHNYSQEYLAEQLNVSRQAVSKWEQDQTSPDTNNLIALAQLFDVSVEYLATGKTAEPVPPVAPPPVQIPPASLGTKRLLGLIFAGAGLLSLILGFLLSGGLVVLGILFLIIAAMCLFLSPKWILILCWAAYGLLFFSITVSVGWTQVSYGPEMAGTSSSAVSGRFLVLLLVPLVILVITTIHQMVKHHRRKKTAGKE